MIRLADQHSIVVYEENKAKFVSRRKREKVYSRRCYKAHKSNDESMNEHDFTNVNRKTLIDCYYHRILPYTIINKKR